MALERVRSSKLFDPSSSATLPTAELLRLIEPLVFVNVSTLSRSRIAVWPAEGVINILPPLTGPNAPSEVAIKVPALIVVVPV